MLNFKTLENGYEIIIIIAAIVVLVAVACSGFGCQNIKWIVTHEMRLIWNVDSFNMPIASYCMICTHGRADSSRCIALHRHRFSITMQKEKMVQIESILEPHFGIAFRCRLHINIRIIFAWIRIKWTIRIWKLIWAFWWKEMSNEYLLYAKISTQIFRGISKWQIWWKWWKAIVRSIVVQTNNAQWSRHWNWTFAWV